MTTPKSSRRCLTAQQMAAFKGGPTASTVEAASRSAAVAIRPTVWLKEHPKQGQECCRATLKLSQLAKAKVATNFNQI